MGIGEQFEFEKTGRINPEHPKNVEPGVEEDGLTLCNFYISCRYRVWQEGCPDNCGKYSPAP